MENVVCQFCHKRCDEPVLLQCKHHICSKCVRTQFSSELLRTPCNHFQSNTEHKQMEGKQEIHDEKKPANIFCPICNEKSILIFSQGDIKLSNNQQLSAVNDGLGENQQQQQYILDEMLQWMLQFFTAKELFTKIRFTCHRMDKIVCSSLLSLHCQGLRINGLKFARTILPKETQLQELNLLLSNIGDNEATKISTIFPSMQQLKRLDLSWNQIGNIGATAIANSVEHLKQLQVLDISYNPIEDSGITAITNATKELTKLQHLSIHEKFSQPIYERVQQVFSQKGIKLNLSSCKIYDANATAVAKILPYLTQLQQLYLGNNQIGHTGAVAIGNSIINLMQLQRLYLSNNQLGHIGATAIVNSITNLTQLQELGLSNNQIGNFGVISIGSSITILTQLQQLILFNNQIGDTGAIAIGNSISNLTQLQRLYLSYNQIGDTGATALANSISNLTRLQHISLHNNQIGDIGAAALANSIKRMTWLNCLTLCDNNISEPTKLHLQEQFGDKLDI